MGFVAALAVFVVGVALLMRKGGEGEGAELESSASAPEDIEAGAEAPREDLNGSGSSDASRAALAVNEGEATAANEVREPGVELVPVVGVHRRRVAPVEVWWWEPKDPENWQELGQLERWLQSGEVDARIAELARKLEPDESGAFHAPTPDATGCVAARSEGLWGWTRVQRSSADPTYVQLESDESLRVRVLDASGAAAPGVRVALRQRWGPDESYAEDFDQAVVLTGPDGTALFPHYRALMKEQWSYGARYALAVAEPFETAIKHEFDPTQPPLERIELQLPPSGSVVLELGAPAPGGQFSLRVSDPRSLDPARILASSESLMRPALDGIVRFPYVGLGLYLTPTSQVQSEARSHDESASLGPTRAGEERRLRIDIHASEKLGMRLVGKLVGPAIRSIGTTRVDVAIQAWGPGPDSWKQHLRVVVTADGRFVIPLQGDATNKADIEFTVRGPRGERVGDARASALGRAGLLELDVGEVFVDSLPLLVSGRVVDASGRRAVGAEVSVLGKRAGGGDRSRDGWERSGNLRTHTDFAGDFEVRGAGDWTALGLAAWNADGASEFQVVSLGSSGVTLTLGADGGIVGSVQTGSGLAREYTRVSVRSEEPTATPAGTAPYRHSEVDADGAFVLRGLAPGLYTVSISNEGTSTAVATIKGVRVEAGQLTRDPRLDPVDLGQWIELQMVDLERASAIPFATAYIVERDTEICRQFHAFSGRLLYRAGSAPFWIATYRYLDELFDPASRATTLPLSRAPIVQVHVGEELLKPLGATQIELTFQSADPSCRLAHERIDRARIDGPLSDPFPLHCARSYSTRLLLNGMKDLKIPYELVGNVSTTAGQTPQVLELRWKPEDLAAELDRARSRNPSHVNQGSGKR